MKTDRDKSSEWWDCLTKQQQAEITVKYYPKFERLFNHLTELEVQKIWKKETQ